jgi:PAS domain S-box-containing protein
MGSIDPDIDPGKRKSMMKTILLVEDEALIALAEQKALERLGYSVKIVHSGEAAVEMAQTEHGLDLVLMDIDLGSGIDGTQAAELILQNHDLPIVFVSSHSEPDVIEKTEKITSYGYIVKSSSIAVFDASIKMAFKLYTKNRELLETRNKLKTTLDVIPDLMFVVNLDGYFEDFHNRPDVHGTAIPPEKIRGSHLRDIFPPEETAFHLALYRRCIETGNIQTHTYELPSDGGQRIFDLQLAKLDDQHVLAIIHDVTDRKLSELRIQSLLEEKEILLKEVHHRIKNSMSTVASLLAIQAADLEDSAAVKALDDARSRIKSMMLLYDKLYHSTNFRDVSLASYLSSLVEETLGNFPNRSMVRVHKDIQDFILDARRLQPLGIIITELLTNIMKYAFRDRDSGLISVSAALTDGRVRIVVQDDGNGMPESVSFENSTGFGFQLVQALVLQLDGTIQLERNNGVRFMVGFPA